MDHRELVLAMHRRINKDELRRAHESFMGTTWDKFFDADAFVHVAANHALRLSEMIRPNSHCLDLGCGFGYVALGLECLGHDCVAWDTQSPVLQAVAKAIKLSARVFTSIERGGGNIGWPRKFDLVFLHGVVPMKDHNGWWNWQDYANMTEHLLGLMNPNGIMEWIVNNGDQVPVACDPSNWQIFAAQRGVLHTVNENIVTVRKPECVVC